MSEPAETGPVEHHAQARRGSFVIARDGDTVGKLTYRIDDDGSWVLTHTYVDREERGCGLGEQLIDAALAKAGEAGARVRATCSFAKAVLERRGR